MAACSKNSNSLDPSLGGEEGAGHVSTTDGVTGVGQPPPANSGYIQEPIHFIRTILCGCSFQVLCDIDYDDEIYERGERAHIKLEICKVQRCYQDERRLN